MRTNYRSRIVENASATLEEDMHFVGDMDGYRVDLEPDPGMGGTGPAPSLCVWCSWAWPGARRWT